MTVDKLKAELNNIDNNQDTNIDNNEIENFLKNEENIHKLWDTMQDLCDAQPEVIDEFKDITSRISEKILKNKNISIHQGKILIFYLQHFHKEWDKIGNKIIKSALKEQRYGQTTAAINMKKFNKQIKKEQELQAANRLNNLPWVKGIQEELEREVKDIKKLLWLLDSTDKLSPKDINRLNEAKNDPKFLITPADRQRLEERLQLESLDDTIIEESESLLMDNILANLDNIDPKIKDLKPNWQKLVKDITSYEEVWKITKENISEYLPIQADKYSEDEIFYITNNFQKLFGRHLCLHPHYWIWWWSNPKDFVTWMSIKNVVIENDMVETASSKLEELKWFKWDKVKEILKTNNHILFDLYLKEEIREAKDDKGRWKKVFDIIWRAEKTNKNKLNSFVHENTFVKDLYNQYKEAVKKQEEAKEIWDLVSQVKEVTIHKSLWVKDAEGHPVEKLKMLSRDQLRMWAPKYQRIKQNRENSEYAEYFCKLYEGSDNFYKWDAIKQLWIPNAMPPQEYFDYMYDLQEMKKDVDKINKEYQEEVARASQNSTYATPNGWWAALLWSVIYSSAKKSSRTTERMVRTAKKFVKLWQTYGCVYQPKSFYWIPLRWDKWNDVDDIIRESFWEKLEDKRDSFCKNVAWADIQQAFWDLWWLIGWVGLGALVTSFSWWNAVLSWIAFEVWTKLGNWVVQWLYDVIVDLWVKRWLWLGKEGWNNRYDGFRESFKLWIGKSKRDENWNPIDAVSWWEWSIDFTVDVAAWATTWWINWNILASPFKFAFIKDFVTKPMLNTIKEWSKAWANVGKYENTWISWWEAIWTTLEDEYTWWNLARKAADVIVVWGMLSQVKRIFEWPCWKYIERAKLKFNDNLEKEWSNVWKILKKFGVKWIKTDDLESLYRWISQGGGGLAQSAFPSAVQNYAAAATDTWATLTKVMALPVFAYWLVSDLWSPRDVLAQRIAYVQERLSKAKTWTEHDRYSELLSRYKELDRQLERDWEPISKKWGKKEIDLKDAIPVWLSDRDNKKIQEELERQTQLGMVTSKLNDDKYILDKQIELDMLASASIPDDDPLGTHDINEAL